MTSAVVLVTGAAGALGTALVAHHLQRGATVVAADRAGLPARADVGPDDHRHADGCAVHDQGIRSPAPRPGRLVPVTGDLTDPDHLADLVAAVARLGDGGLDLLVHCAGVAHRSPATSTPMDVFDHVMAVNWRAPVELTRLAREQLAVARGTVVVLGSMAGWMPVLGRSAYGASKAAVSQFMEVWRHELAADGIEVVMVYPSFLESVMADTAVTPDRAGAAAPRRRSEVGTPMPIDELVTRIDDAVDARDRWVFPDRFARAASLLYHVAPGAYHRLMHRRFRQELHP